MRNFRLPPPRGAYLQYSVLLFDTGLLPTNATQQAKTDRRLDTTRLRTSARDTDSNLKQPS